MNIISSKTSQISLSLRTTVKLTNAQNKLLRQALVATLDECGQFVLKQGKRHGLGLKGVNALDISMTLCGRQKIRSINRQWREKDYATDVLSFPVHDDLRGNEWPLPPTLELGDLFICHQVAISQAKEYKVTWEQEIIHLFIHGLLHLLGFDHEVSASEEKIMQKHEETLVKKTYRRLGLES